MPTKTPPVSAPPPQPPDARRLALEEAARELLDVLNRPGLDTDVRWAMETLSRALPADPNTHLAAAPASRPGDAAPTTKNEED
jgi:hypothetical protein